MSDPIRILVVDDIPETREHLAKLLGFESDMEVAGAAESGPEALQLAQQLHPDVVLMDINMPGMDGIATSEQLSSLVPSAAVIMMSVQGEADYLRRSMLAGAREFLVKPFSADELTTSIRKVREREVEKHSRAADRAGADAPVRAPARRDQHGTVATVFSPKGGVGRSTIAVNLAAAAAQEGRKVALVDGSLQFGDIGVMLNLDPRQRSMADLVPEIAAGVPESLETVLVHHDSGVDVLLAPPTPETAELVTPAYMRGVLERLRSDHDLVIVDTQPILNDMVLTMLDVADVILAVLTLEITNIRNLRVFLEVARQLGYDDGRIRLVLNRADSSLGIRVADVERSLGRKVDNSIVSDGRSVVYALNRGVPFVISNPEAQVSQDLFHLERDLSGMQPDTPAAEPARSAQRRSIFAWR
ncbi:MAG TPA: response regulator [Candidatus Saccharimonadales bacterium]|nr:response regulator [Candidatus Saccharimonadales bacterium]